jgi:hypothetical protein
MIYIGFINREGDSLEVYIDADNDLCLCIRYSNNNEFNVKIEKEDVNNLIKALEEYKIALDNL